MFNINDSRKVADYKRIWRDSCISVCYLRQWCCFAKLLTFVMCHLHTVYQKSVGIIKVLVTLIVRACFFFPRGTKTESVLFTIQIVWWLSFCAALVITGYYFLYFGKWNAAIVRGLRTLCTCLAEMSSTSIRGLAVPADITARLRFTCPKTVINCAINNKAFPELAYIGKLFRALLIKTQARESLETNFDVTRSLNKTF